MLGAEGRTTHVLRIAVAERDSPAYLAETARVAGLAREVGIEAAPGAPFRSLRDWRETLGGSRGSLVDPVGRPHRLTLERWADADPDRTMICVSFVEYNPRFYGPGRANPLPPDDA
ncbi:MAG TPA: hypothetical protein VLN26_17405 [Gaiellaceae bacterium]|nr:hypothetical protein [Gaiellaceae bacterium]